MAEKVTSKWNGRSYTFEFYPDEEYERIANYIQACAAILENDDNFDGRVEFPFVVAKADIPYSKIRNVNGWKMKLPAGFTKSHPRNSSLPLIIIQEGLFENGKYREFTGILTHEIAHLMFPHSEEPEVQEKGIRLLELIDHNLEKFNENPKAIKQVLQNIRGKTKFRPMEHQALQGGIKFLKFSQRNIRYFQH